MNLSYRQINCVDAFYNTNIYDDQRRIVGEKKESKSNQRLFLVFLKSIFA